MLDLTKPRVSFGLLSCSAVRLFLNNEPGIRDEICAFFADRRPGPNADILDVVGPPSILDIAWAKTHPREPIMVPVIRMHMRKVTNNVTGERGVEIKISDGDEALLKDWLRHGRDRHALNQRMSA